MKRNMSRTEGPTNRAKVRNFMPFQIGPLVRNRKEVSNLQRKMKIYVFYEATRTRIGKAQVLGYPLQDQFISPASLAAVL